MAAWVEELKRLAPRKHLYRDRFRIAGQRQAVPWRVLAPHLRALDKSPRGLPYLSGPVPRFRGFIGAFEADPPA